MSKHTPLPIYTCDLCGKTKSQYSDHRPNNWGEIKVYFSHYKDHKEYEICDSCHPYNQGGEHCAEVGPSLIKRIMAKLEKEGKK